MTRLKRIVKLPLKEGKFEELKKIFNFGKEIVAATEGCFYVRLLKDHNDPNLVFTISEWTDEDSLNNYRNSDEFRKYWPEIKCLLNKKPEVWSLIQIDSKRIEGDGT